MRNHIFLIVAAVICIAVAITVICWDSKSSSADHDRAISEPIMKRDLQKTIGLLDSGKAPAEDIVTWRLFAVHASKTGKRKFLESLLNRISVIIEHPPTLATLYLECHRSDSGDNLLDKLQSALDEKAAAYILLYGFQSGQFDVIKEILTRFSNSVEIRLRAGQLLQVAVTSNNRDAIEALNSFCYYFDREAAVQIAVHLNDMDLIMTLDDIPLEQRWRHQLGLAAMFAAYDDRNERLCWHIYRHFSLSTELSDRKRFASQIYCKWYFTSRDMGQNWYDQMILMAPPETSSITEGNINELYSIQRAFIDGIIHGDLQSIEVALTDLRQQDNLYSGALVAGCIVASSHKQQEILDKLLHLTDDRIRAGVIMVAGHIRNLHLLTAIVDLPVLKRSIFIKSEIGRLMEHAVINSDKEMYSILLRFKRRDDFITFGMIRASVYAIRHGERFWTDAIFEALHVLELRHGNRLLIHVIGAALETERYELAFDYWRLRFEMNEHAMEIRQNTRKGREYTSDTDRVGHPASDRYLSVGFGTMMTSVPALEPLPELLQKILKRGYDIDPDLCEEKLMCLKNISNEFWKRPERDPVPKNIFLPDYCKQRRPDLFPEFSGVAPLPVPNGWHELARAVLMDLQNWGRNIPQLQQTVEGIPDHFRPVNT